MTLRKAKRIMLTTTLRPYVEKVHLPHLTKLRPYAKASKELRVAYGDGERLGHVMNLYLEKDD